MIERIVRMHFKEGNAETFLKVFEDSKQLIAGFEGCQGLKLMKDVNNPNVFFTYSYWDSEVDLNAYRSSTLFQSTWSKTKILFESKAQAWSLTVEDLVK